MTQIKSHIPKIRFKEFSGEWEKKKLGAVGEIVGGGTPETGKNEFWGGEIQWFTPTELKTKYVSKSKRTISDLGLKKSSAKILPKNTILLSSRATIGDVSIALNECTTNQGFQSIIVNDKNDFNFFYFLINNNKKELIKKASGSTFLEISKTEISKLKFLFPQLTEQKKISSFLSIVDEKIENIREKKKALEEYKKGVMQKLFKQEIRFRDENGEEFGDWEEKNIGELGLYISDGNYGEMYPKASEMIDFGTPFIRANNIKNFKLIWDDMKYISDDLHSILTSGHLQTDDILITTRGDIGMLAYVNNEFNNCNINAQICLLRIVDKNTLFPKYLLHILSSRFCQKQFTELETGSALKQLPKGNLDKVKIFLPSLPEQQKIADFLCGIDEKIEKVGEDLVRVEEFKRGLLQGMFV